MKHLAMTEVLVVLILWSFRMRALTLYVGSLATGQVVSMSTWVLVPLLPVVEDIVLYTTCDGGGGAAAAPAAPVALAAASAAGSGWRTRSG